MEIKKYKTIAHAIATVGIMFNVLLLLDILSKYLGEYILEINIAVFILLILLSLIIKTSKVTAQNSDEFEQKNTVKNNLNEDIELETKETLSTFKNFIPLDYSTNENLLDNFLINISKEYDLAQGICFLKNSENLYIPVAEYAYFAEEKPSTFIEGNGLSGQAVKNKKQVLIKDIPENYTEIISGLGKAFPKEILITPIINDKNKVIGTLEIATLGSFTKEQQNEINENCYKLYNELKNI